MLDAGLWFRYEARLLLHEECNRRPYFSLALQEQHRDRDMKSYTESYDRKPTDRQVAAGHTDIELLDSLDTARRLGA